MEFLRNNSQAIIFTVPICWGIYEIRKFNSIFSSYLPVIREFLEVMKTTNTQVEDLKPIFHNLNEKVNKLSEGDNTVFPIVSQLHLLSQRINVMFTRIYAPLGNESPLGNE